MKLKLFQIDAFTDKVFSGNPAAVCVLDSWLEDSLMQQIAMENNLAETAYAVKKGEKYEIRWFTPETEVDLCGHATLATAYVMFHFFNVGDTLIEFYSPRSCILTVDIEDNGYLNMDFPKFETCEVQDIVGITEAFGSTPLKKIKGKTDYLLIYPSQKQIERIKPDFRLLDQLDCRGVIVSAPGDKVDFVSRFFAPQCGIPEDPVTGSAHTTLIPYWAKILSKNKMTAKQLSPRGGDLLCENSGERVKISGKAVLYFVGELAI
jgi:PhzF family phenazine biosynthesis protein